MEKNDLIEAVETQILDLEFKDNNYLYFVSTYLKSLEDSSKINDFIKDIRKGISYLESQFDEIFLLVGSDLDKNLFIEKENKNLINCFEYLVELLGEFEYIAEADKLNQIKTKISLGYDRYFVQKDKLVNWFSSTDLDFEIYGELDVENEVSVLRILNNYLDTKNLVEFKKFKKYIEKFPNKIYRNSNLDLIDIQKSLFFDENFEVDEFLKGKIKICDFDSFEVLVKYLELLNLKND